jgi:uncharacterized iron-regulated protein
MLHPFLTRHFCYPICLVLMAALTSCASKPEAPVLNKLAGDALAITTTRLDALLPTDMLLLGEQHDAKAHQQIHSEVIALLAQRGLLAAVALEMADVGATTAGLHPSSTEQQTQSALKWNDKGWPWAAYGPAVMTAVRAGVPVLGANQPRELMRGNMGDAALDGKLPGPALKAQQQLIRMGHCNLLPESQITPMTRIQIAKDISMANTLVQAASTANSSGKVVVLLSGSGHTDRMLGVPQHLPASLKVKAVRLRAGDAALDDKAEAFDAVWATPALPEKDYCAEFKAQMGK